MRARAGRRLVQHPARGRHRRADVDYGRPAACSACWDQGRIQDCNYPQQAASGRLVRIRTYSPCHHCGPGSRR